MKTKTLGFSTDSYFPLCSNHHHSYGNFSKSRGLTAHWNEEETKALLTYLLEHKSEMGDGDTFKMGTFNSAATEMTVHHTLGPVKTGKMCRIKWQTVIIYVLFLSLMSDDLSSKQSTALFRSSKKRHLVFTGTMLREQMSGWNQRCLCGTDMWQSRYFSIIIYINKCIKASIKLSGKFYNVALL